MAIQQRLYTADEFWEMAQEFEEGKRFELVQGLIVEMAPSSPRNSVIAMRIGRFIGNYVEEHDLGYVMGPDGGYTLSPDNVRIPDISFVSKARAPTLPERFIGGPDLAVEVLSPSETSRSVIDKVRLFLSAGTRIVWVIYPDERVVDVYRPAGEGMHVQEFDAESTLDGGEVLPGFTLPVQKIFPET